MSRGPSRSSLRRFWCLIRQGLLVREAAAAVGVSERRAFAWFAQAGGMPPLQLVPGLSGRHLSLIDREAIYAGLNQGQSYAAIARSIGRRTSTVTRELEVNRLNPSRPRAVPLGQRAGARGRVPESPNYSPSVAQRRFESRLARPKMSKLAANTRLQEEVEARLKQNHSPEQISGRLVTDFADDPEMRVSHETIYRALYVQGRGALNRELTRHLRTGRALRKPRRQPGRRQPRIKDMVSISDRPPEVEDRAVPGHWEGDLITGEQNQSAIGTLVERMTGFLMLLHLADGRGAVAVEQAMIAKMSQLPQLLRRTLTWDQGNEMANHVHIAAATDLDIYFCDPHSPWQRGTNENTNGLLRQYFPKGSDLSRWGPGYLDYVAAELNNRPRKRLGWKTPAEALDELLSQPTDPPTVAMTG
jgi:transposase, IS30 family